MLVQTSEGSTLGADAAAAYEALNIAFTARFGKRLAINSGSRTYDEQVQIFTTNHTLTRVAHTPGRFVTRTWRGQLWYLRPGFATAAIPGTSNHEYPPGKAADFGSGVQTLGSTEHRWMRLWAGAWGWEWTGGTFVTIEPWHWEKNFSWARTGSKPFEPEEDMLSPTDLALLQHVSAKLTDVLNALNDPTNGIFQNASDAADHAEQADLELDEALLKINHTANMVSDLRNAVNDPNSGLQVKLDRILAKEPGAAGELSDAELDLIAKATADERDRRERERLGGAPGGN